MRIVIAVILVGLMAGGTVWYLKADTPAAASYKTAAVTRGDLVATIGATGTVEPEEVIDVGAQVTGQVVEFGKDTSGKTIDYSAQVKQGDMVARIDDVLYVAAVTEAQAQLASAKASVLRAKADLQNAQAKLYAAQRDWERAERIGSSDALAQTTYDNYKSTFEQGKANVAVYEAAVAVAEAAVDQNDSALKRAQRNLGYTVITSPVTGTVIARRVNIGQTVTSNLDVASLFLIARDLKKMQVWVSVNEADIGQVHVDQPVTFTVDAFPGEKFEGVVRKIRLNAAMTQNVVTYTVEVSTDNSSGRLLPYLTANVQFQVSKREDVLSVPNAALRWAPADMIKKGPGAGGGGGGVGSASGAGAGTTAGGRKRSTTQLSDSSGGEGRRGTIWVADIAGPKAVHVRVGTTDGTNTEVSGEGLEEGMEVITGENQAQAAASGGSTNPFMPKLPSRRR